MMLENIVKEYGGWYDYYDFVTGRTYLLSQAIHNENGFIDVPTEDPRRQFHRICKDE
jgi:hypothetical protein